MRMGERTKRILALLTAGAMVFTNTGMDVLASTSIVVGGITSGEDKKGETPAESDSCHGKPGIYTRRSSGSYRILIYMWTDYSTKHHDGSICCNG